MTCATCKHAKPVDAAGPWTRMGFDFEGHRHCGRWEVETWSVIPASLGCIHNPPRWEPNA